MAAAPRVPAIDAACPALLPGSAPGSACLLDCPKLNCTGATALCYELPECVAVDISFGHLGRAAVARLRFGGDPREEA